MARYAFRRALLGVLVLWLISLAVFVLLRMIPGEPALLQQGMNATPEQIALLRRELGLNDPLPLQYLRWLAGLARLDLGRSALTHVSVASEFRDRLPVTFELMVLAMCATVLVGIPAGVLSAARRGTTPDYAARFLVILALATPSFWLATLVLALPQQQWGYAPPLDGARALFDEPMTNLRQFVPPAIVLALPATAGVMRLTRSSLLEALRADYVRTARAKGLAERAVIYRHALRNAIIPVLTLIGLQLATLMGGSVIVESIFNLNGLGQYLFQAILQKDFAVAQSLVLYVAGAVVALNLAVDLCYAWLDPRIHYA